MSYRITDDPVPGNPDDVSTDEGKIDLTVKPSYAGSYNPDWKAPTYKSFLDPNKPYIYLNDDVQLLNTMSQPQIVQIQSLLTKAFPGFKPVNVGSRYDAKTKTYFGYALARINNESEVRGKPIWQALPYLAQNPLATTAPKTSKAPTYRISNPADLRKVVEQSSQYVLGHSIDEATTQRLIKAYQGIQVDEQKRNASSGVQVQAPDAGTFTENQINKQFGAEAQSYRAGGLADIMDSAIEKWSN